MVAVGVPYGAVGEPELSSAGAAAVTRLDKLTAELRRRGLLAE